MEGMTMLWAIASILIVFWLLGLIFHVASWAIHLLLVAAVALIVINFVRGSRSGTV